MHNNTSPLLSIFKHRHNIFPISSLLFFTISSSMAPRKRKQTGLTRMDAALDQVSCFGFSKQLIRRTVNNLLKVYGEDGWKLIEEDGYRVVLDFILDEQESAQKQNLLKHDESSHSKQEETGKELVKAEVNAVAPKDESSEENNNSSLTINTGVENDECCKDTPMDIFAHSSTFQDDKNSADKINTNCSKNAPLTIPTPDVAHTPVSFYARRRKPCYGWIGDDDDDDEDEETCFKKVTLAK